MRNYSAVLLLLALIGCSVDDDSNGPAGQPGHAWQEQSDMIERSKDVEDLLDEANLQRRQQLDEQTQ